MALPTAPPASDDIGFDRGIAARIDDLAGVNFNDGGERHGI